MRIKHNQHGDVRIKTTFLFWPKLIKNETRWLEKVKIRQYYSYNRCGWINDKWVD